MRKTTIKDVYFTVADQVRYRRKLAGLTEEDLAQAIGYTRSSISFIENVKQRTPLHTLYAIAEACGCKISDLLPRKGR